MNTKTFIIWFLLIAAVVLAVAADTSVDNKKQGGKEVETSTVEGENNDKDGLNYEVDQKGWRGGGGRGGGWRGGGGRGGGWRGGGGRGGGWRGGGGRGRGGGGGFADELTTEQVNDDKGDISQGVAGYGGWGGPWGGGYGGWGGPWRGGYGGWGGPWRGGYGGWGGPWRGGYGGWGGPWRGGYGGWGRGW